MHPPAGTSPDGISCRREHETEYSGQLPGQANNSSGFPFQDTWESPLTLQYRQCLGKLPADFSGAFLTATMDLPEESGACEKTGNVRIGGKAVFLCNFTGRSSIAISETHICAGF
jgi:hypothetical protein